MFDLERFTLWYAAFVAECSEEEGGWVYNIGGGGGGGDPVDGPPFDWYQSAIFP